MAWSISTYAGTQATGDPSNWRTAMFELCRAVNERQGAIGLTKTQFYKADGTQSADISMADLEDAQWTGTSSNMGTNMTRIQSAILAMIGGFTYKKFVTASGGATPYTVASVESAIGTDLTLPITNPQEARFWQAQQDALDLLLHYRAELSVVIIGPTLDSAYSSNLYGSAALAWTNRAENSGGLSIPPVLAGWGIDIQSGGTQYKANIVEQGTAAILAPSQHSAASGSYVGTDILYSANVSDLTSGTMDFNVGGESITVSSDGAGTHASSTNLLTITSITAYVETAEPSSNPFAASSFDMSASIFPQTIYVWYDIASELTDQA